MSGAGGASPEVVTVRKFTYAGAYVTSWRGEVVERTEDHVVLRATWTRGSTEVAGITFEPGDIFLEYYYPGRPYSLWGVYSPDGAILKGWYCNVGLPMNVEGSTFDVRDLILDVLVFPDGHYTVLDRDELAAARALGLSEALARTAEAGVTAILDLLERRAAPFTALGGAAPAARGE